MFKQTGPSSAVNDLGIQLSLDRDILKYIESKRCLILDRSPIDSDNVFYVELQNIEKYLLEYDNETKIQEKDIIKKNIIEFATLLGYKCKFI